MASEKSNTLYKELLKRGFHEELCKEIAFKYMNTDYTATRMLGYLYRINYLSAYWRNAGDFRGPRKISQKTWNGRSAGVYKQSL